MSTYTYKKNDDLESGHIDKMTVYQECNAGFNATPIQAKKCRLLLAKLVHLLSTGESFQANEATTLFFGITKLFQHKDPSLRQMVYLAIKELSSSAEDVIMATSSIMKDVQSTNDSIFKPNAIRALIRVSDTANVQTIERLMKTAIVDKHAAISSSALVSSYHLLPIAKDAVRRWASEVQEAVSTPKVHPQASFEHRYTSGVSHMTQYHALDLLYHLRAHDKMALIKLIHQLSSNSQSSVAVRSPNAVVMLIRYISSIIQEDHSNVDKTLVAYLEDWLKHKSDVVNIEAAKALLSIESLTDAEANNVINTLHVFLSSPRTVSKFAAIRLLNRYALKRPQCVALCNTDIENLITDPSRSIATYAITTLLKTGNESSLDRLMSQISGFMSDITDEFKCIVIDAIRSLALKFPKKHNSMLGFLASSLRDEGGLNFKTAVVEALFDMIQYIPESRDAALGHLCEFIEDCEFTELSIRILHLLGQEGPSTENPTVYVRYIYNRVVLENAIIRAAAVTALAQFGLTDDAAIKESIRVLLTRCLADVADEVRDRAALSLRLLGLDDPATAQSFISPKEKYALPQLEYQLAVYISGDGDMTVPFDINNVPKISREEALAEALKRKTQSLTQEEAPSANDKTRDEKKHTKKGGDAGAGDSHLQGEIDRREYANALASIPEIEAYGEDLFKSSKTVLAEDEYKVTAIKHIFKTHLVIQYEVENTVKDYVLENVEVEGAFEETDTEPVSQEVQETSLIPIDKLEPFNKDSVYVLYDSPSGEPFTGIFTYGLRMVVKELSDGVADEEGFEDEYDLTELKLVIGDYLVPAFVGNVQHIWDELGPQSEATSTYQLGRGTNLRDTTNTLVEFYSMAPIEGSDIVNSETSHTLKLCGKSYTGDKVFAQVQMVYSTKSGVTIKVSARCTNPRLATLVADAVEAL